MKYKIVVPDSLTLNDLEKEIKKGGKFIVYAYCISLVVAVFAKGLSKAYFIYSHEKATKYKNKSNWINYILGWWALPHGVIKTIEYIKLNNNGGIDVTEDVLLNLDDESFLKKEINLKVVSIIFKIPDKYEVGSLKKAIDKKLSPTIIIDRLFFGLFINVEANEDPYFVVGFKSKTNFELSAAELKKAIYTQFYKYAKFQFVNLNDENEFNKKLETQGLRLI